MKKFIISSLFSLMMVFALLPEAHAQEFCALGSYPAGTEINCYIAEVSKDAEVFAEGMPSELSLIETVTGDVKQLSVRGVPKLAGSLSFNIKVSEAPDLIVCSAEISPATPSVTASGDINCALNEVVTLSVSASANDFGVLSYQWHHGTSYPGPAIEGATGNSYIPDTSALGTSSYYCKVTNQNNGMKVASSSEMMYVTVSEPSIDKLTVNTLPAKLSYRLGDSIDTTGLSIIVHYVDGSSIVLDSGFEASPAVFNKPGEQQVTLSYGGFSCAYLVDVKINEADIEGIGVLTLPDITEYEVGDTLDTMGLSIRVYTATGKFDISEGFECTPTVLKSSGRQTISVHYAGNSCSFTVKVMDNNTLESIDIASLPIRREYAVGDTLDLSGMSLQLRYGGRTEIINQGFSCSPQSFSSAGSQTVTVTYEGLSTSFTINVKEAAAPSTSPSPSAKPSTAPTVEPSGNPVPSASAAPEIDRGHQAKALSGLVKVIFFVALASLVGLAGYVLYMQKKGKR